MGPNSSPASTFLLIALMVAALYLLIIRPNKKRQQAQQKTMSALTPGTRVLLTSGIFATIVELGERQAVLETSPGVQLTVLKQAIARTVLPSDEDSVTDDELDDAELDDDALDHQSDDVDAVGPGAQSGSPVQNGSHAAPTLMLDGDGTRQPVGPDLDQDPRTGISNTPIKD